MDLSALLPGIVIIGALLVVVFADRRLGREPFDAAAFLPHPWELGWPRGVQEEDLEPFRVERIGRLSGASDSRATSPGVAHARPAAQSHFIG